MKRNRIVQLMEVHFPHQIIVMMKLYGMLLADKIYYLFSSGGISVQPH